MGKSWLLVKCGKIWELPNVPTCFVITVTFCNKCRCNNIIVAFCNNCCIYDKTAAFCNKQSNGQELSVVIFNINLLCNWL